MAILTPQAQIVALFNAKNSSLANALTVADVTFGAVAVYTPADGGDTRNTKVTITAADNSEHFTGAKELHYTRLAASTLVGNKAVTEAQADWDTDEEVLAKFNTDVAAKYASDAFALNDLTIVRTDGDSGAKVITINLKVGHGKFIDGVAAVYTVTEEIQKTDLSTTNGDLDGFTD